MVRSVSFRRKIANGSYDGKTYIRCYPPFLTTRQSKKIGSYISVATAGFTRRARWFYCTQDHAAIPWHRRLRAIPPSEFRSSASDLKRSRTRLQRILDADSDSSGISFADPFRKSRTWNREMQLIHFLVGWARSQFSDAPFHPPRSIITIPATNVQ